MTSKALPKKIQVDGVILPLQTNSDGRPIKFIFQCVSGRIYHILGDHLIKKLNKKSFQRVRIQGLKRRKGPEIFIKIQKLIDRVSVI